MKNNWEPFLVKVFLALGACAVCVSFVSAGIFSKDAIGTTGGQFLELPVGARGVAMGSAQGAAAEDASAIYYNPANLAGLRGINVTFMHAIYFQDISYDFAAFAKQTQDHGAIAFGLQYLSMGSLDKVDNTGNPTGDSMAPRDLALSIANARKFENLEYGFAIKYISSRLNESANAYAIDGGVRWSAEPIAFSASIANLGSGLKFRKETAPLPTTVRLGSSYKIIPQLRDKIWSFALDVVLSKGAAAAVCAGAEYKVDIKELMKIAGRMGYNTRVSAGGLGGASGFSAGIGFDINRFFMDYAFTPFGDLGNSHRISLSMKFGDDDIYEREPAVRKRTVRPAKKKRRVGPINFASGSEAIIKVSKAKLYRYHDAESKVLAILKRGMEMEVQKQRGDWVKVYTETGKIGWVRKSVLKKKALQFFDW